MKIRRQEVVEVIAREQVSAIIRTKVQSVAAGAISAAVDGGFRMVEFTLTTPGALELIADFAKRPPIKGSPRGLLVGAGTVMSASAAREAAAAGAQFIVSPICDPKVLAEAARLDVACIPGAFTPTEMEHAHALGADFVKVFPAPPGGVEYIQAVLAPLPHLRLFPTAAVTPENFLDYLRAGCAGVGFVRSLFEPRDLANGNFKAITERAAGIVKRFQAWHGT